MLYVVGPTPTPPSQELGGAVVIRRVEGISAAQNIYPSIPEVVPAPLGATVRTNVPVEFWSEFAKLLHSGAMFVPLTM